MLSEGHGAWKCRGTMQSVGPFRCTSITCIRHGDRDITTLTPPLLPYLESTLRGVTTLTAPRPGLAQTLPSFVTSLVALPRNVWRVVCRHRPTRHDVESMTSHVSRQRANRLWRHTFIQNIKMLITGRLIIFHGNFSAQDIQRILVHSSSRLWQTSDCVRRRLLATKKRLSSIILLMCAICKLG